MHLLTQSGGNPGRTADGYMGRKIILRRGGQENDLHNRTMYITGVVRDYDRRPSAPLLGAYGLYFVDVVHVSSSDVHSKFLLSVHRIGRLLTIMIPQETISCKVFYSTAFCPSQAGRCPTAWTLQRHDGKRRRNRLTCSQFLRLYKRDNQIDLKFV